MTSLRTRLLRSLILGAVFAAAVIAGYLYVQRSEKVDGTPALLRANLENNAQIFGTFHSNSRMSVSKPAPPKGTLLRYNGDLGLRSGMKLANYQIEVESGEKRIGLMLKDMTSLPKVSESTDFRCIEGWSEVLHYSGLRFSEFMKAFDVGRKPDGTLYRYVGLETPDGKYYVSLDMESMLHPQTILAYELNHLPIKVNNGAPLRLVIPIKYGIKSLKRIGRIKFSDTRPPDYWAERGYDWYAGL